MWMLLNIILSVYLYLFIGFVCQGFRSREATRVASMQSCYKLYSCLTEPMPASSKTDPPLAKAEPISNCGSASVITYLRRGGKNPKRAQEQLEE